MPTFHVTIRKVEDIFVEISASSPERALQLAANIAADHSEGIEYQIIGTKTTETPLANSVKRVGR